MVSIRAAQDQDGISRPVPEGVADLYQRVWDEVIDSVPDGVDEQWPAVVDGVDKMVISGPWGAALSITPRLDDTGALTGAAWRGQRADASAIIGHGSPPAAVSAAADWASCLDRTPAITGVELAARRAATGATQADLARILDVGQSVISQWESGRRAPRDPDGVLAAIEALEALANDLRDQAVDDGTTTGVVPVWDAPEAYRAARPDEVERGASPAMRRMAAARAWHDLRNQGSYARIIPGHTTDETREKA
ncbi:helix-turn-helix domain-containing protein [Actinomyces gaoshouyii]|uniref:helix-turn-helix domain-containing protein n=1 Tax=Actinomyces gaoshouyii TaxID=1960083 RepID=UPI0013DE4D36|nr:helix-turn-helix transcriptional regulator [Actinomyces gaoshouyii]